MSDLTRPMPPWPSCPLGERLQHARVLLKIYGYLRDTEDQRIKARLEQEWAHDTRREPTEGGHAEIIRDVLTLVDGYLAQQPPDTLTSDGQGVMTWAELREHIAGAKALLKASRG